MLAGARVELPGTLPGRSLNSGIISILLQSTLFDRQRRYEKWADAPIPVSVNGAIASVPGHSDNDYAALARSNLLFSDELFRSEMF
jgi:hypothetical protein